MESLLLLRIDAPLLIKGDLRLRAFGYRETL